MDLHERLRCFGYFGYGSGFALAAEIHNRAHEHCSASCPARETCRERHEIRVRSFARTDYTEQLGEPPDETGLTPFTRVLPQLYVLAMAANLRDGISIAISGAPVWRGERTIPLSLP